jgi:hypothetical protein
MSKYALALAPHIDFHISYRDFLDDLYLTYLFNPVGYSVSDVFLFSPYAYSELVKGPNSLLRHMIQSGLVKGHFRSPDQSDVAQLFERSQRRDPRTPGFFQSSLLLLRQLNAGAHLQLPEAREIALILDAIELRPDFVQPWHREPDGSLADTSVHFEKSVLRVTTAEFRNELISRLGDDPLLEAKTAELSRLQEFVQSLIEPQRHFHNGVGLRVSSSMKAIAALNGVQRPEQVLTATDLFDALAASNKAHVIALAKNALRVLTDRHSKTMSDFLGAGYSNPRSTNLTLMLAINDGPDDRTSGERISEVVSIPGLSRFQTMPIAELDDLLQESGFSQYREAFAAWNLDPTVPNVVALIASIKRIEESLRQKFPGEKRRKSVVEFCHRLANTLYYRWTVFQIESQSSYVHAAADLLDATSPLLRAAGIGTVVGASVGNPLKGVLDAGTKELTSGTLASRYEQFALSRQVAAPERHLISLTRNIARNNSVSI